MVMKLVRNAAAVAGSHHMNHSDDHRVDNLSAVVEHDVPEKVLLAHWQDLQTKRRAKSGLVVVLLAVLFFSILALGRARTREVYAIESAIKFDIEENANFGFSSNMGFKNYQNVNSIADLYSWVRLGFGGIYFFTASPGKSEGFKPPANNVSVNISAPESPMYLTNNKRIGPVRIGQEKSMLQECPTKKLAADLNASCREPGSITGLFVQPTMFAVSNAKMRLDAEAWMDADFLTQEDYQDFVNELEVEGWIGSDTSRVVISFTTYNSEADLLTTTEVHFIISETGHIWKQLNFRTVPLAAYPDVQTFVFEILFYCCTTWLLFKEIFVIVRQLKLSSKYKVSFRRTYWTFTAFANWLTVLYGYIVLGLWLVICSIVPAIRDQAADLVSLCGGNSLVSDDCETLAEDLIADADRMGRLWQTERLVEGLYCLCFLLQLLDGFRAQPRLAVITMTIFASLGELAYFMIAFGSIFTVFAMMSMSLFGRSVMEFSSFEISCMSLFRALMGDLDYAPLEAQCGRLLAFLFFALFSATSVLILMNMLIAIVMDVYASRKQAATDEDSSLTDDLISFCVRTLQEYRKERLPVSRILERFLARSEAERPFESTHMVSMAALVVQVPGLSEAQAREELHRAWAYDQRHGGSAEAEVSQPSFSEALRAARRLDRGLTKEERDLMKELLDENQARPELPTGTKSPPTEGWHPPSVLPDSSHS